MVHRHYTSIKHRYEDIAPKR